MPRFPVLVLGGYGVFGSRICRRLADDPRIRVIVAGRSRAKADTLVGQIAGAVPQAELEARVIDIRGPLHDAFQGLAGGAVVNAVGPFQSQAYDVAEACIEAGINYLDLADGRAFVCSIDALDGRAKQAGVVAISGASSVPGLSSCVVDTLRPEFSIIDEIRMGIAPGNQVPRGLAVLEAILGYVGKPIPRWRNGQFETVYGWQDLMRRPLGLASERPVGTRWFSACDVPDLVLFPDRYAVRNTVTFHAGHELGALHLGLWCLSWGVRAGIVPELSRYARSIGAMAGLFERLGSDRGGMFVELVGEGHDAKPLRRTWTIVADSGHGPHIPTIAAVILAKQLASGKIAWRGARPCLGMFSLDEFAAEVASFDIKFEISIKYHCFNVLLFASHPQPQHVVWISAPTFPASQRSL